MQRAELDVLLDWAAAEGWNPGLHDAQLFWDTDPEAFIAVELDGRLAGGGAIVSYGGAYGFMGLFIVREDLRGHGLGSRLWHERKRMLCARLNPGAPIGMDGVFAMQPFYARGGFALEHRELRFEWVAEAAPTDGASSGQGDAPICARRASASPSDASLDEVAIVPLRDLRADDVIAFDAQHFPVPRARFITAWTAQPGAIALGAVRRGTIVGMAVARQCRVGRKVGPLFAHSPAIADALLRVIESRMPGERAQIDMPEPNAAALRLAASRGMRETFGCAKMTLGTAPSIPIERVFGVTTFELG